MNSEHLQKTMRICVENVKGSVERYRIEMHEGKMAFKDIGVDPGQPLQYSCLPTEQGI